MPWRQFILRLRRSARSLLRAPGLLCALLLTIELGTGANAAVYGFLAGLSRPAATFQHPERMVSILAVDGRGDTQALTPAEYSLLTSRSEIFEWTGAARIEPIEIEIGGQPAIASVAALTPGFAAQLNQPIARGALVSHRLWQTVLQGKADLQGETIHAGNATLPIDGVAPDALKGLYSGQAIDLWTATNESPANAARGERRDEWVFARLRPGVSASKAQELLHAAAPALSTVTVTTYTGLSPDLEHGLARVHAFLNFSTAVVFFIGCINVASLLLGRAFRRTLETSLRIALGATRGELLRDLLADSVVVSLAGGAAGVLLGMGTAHALPALLFEQDAQGMNFSPHTLPILLAALICVATTALFGMAPMLGTATGRPWEVLKRESGSPSRGVQRLRSALVLAQIAACCVLVMCTTLLLGGLHAALKTGSGDRLGNPILLSVQAAGRPFVETGYFREVEENARKVSGVAPLAWTSQLPGGMPAWRTFRIFPAPLRTRSLELEVRQLTPEVLQSIESNPAAGRFAQVRDQGRTVALLNEQAAKKIFGAETVGIILRNAEQQPVEVIGIVREKPTASGAPHKPAIYYDTYDRQGMSAAAQRATFQVPMESPQEETELNVTAVSSNYFKVLGMRLIAGQSLPGGTLPGTEHSAVVNEEAAALYFQGRPLGAAVIDAGGNRTYIVGVVRQQALGRFERRSEPTIYFSMWQNAVPRMTLMLAHGQWNHKMEKNLLKSVANLPNEGTSPPAVTDLDSQLQRSGLAALRIATLIGGVSVGAALLLGLLGVLSAQADAEQRRMSDRALRIALGAQRRHITLLVMANAGKLALAGTGVGLLLSLALYRVVTAGVAIAPPSLAVWLLAPLAPAAMVLLASSVPAARAARVSPLVILKEKG